MTINISLLECVYALIPIGIHLGPWEQNVYTVKMNNILAMILDLNDDLYLVGNQRGHGICSMNRIYGLLNCHDQNFITKMTQILNVV